MSSVTEVKQAPGRWEITLKRGTPREIIDALTPFGHIAVAPGEINVAAVGDNLLTEARYVGVYRGGKVAGDDFQLTGSGMPFWLGDEDGKGPLIESVSASSASFAQAINLVLPAAIEAGTIYSTPGSSLTHKFQYEQPRNALNFITKTFGTPTVPVSWRVNGNGTLDAGPDSQLYNLNPTAILVKKDVVLRTGRGFDVIGVAGDLQLETMYNDYTTKVVVLGAGEQGAVVAASAAQDPSLIPYTDMHGNKVVFTRLVDELDADGVSIAPALAASLLSRFDTPTFGATLSSEDYDVRGDFEVGDHVAAFDPDIGFVDPIHEMYYEGVPINPMFLQVQGLTWPIQEGFTVAFRTMTGTWLDLTDYYKPAGGQTLIDVGSNPSGLTSLGFDIDRSRVVADSSIPATPVFGTFYTTTYENFEGDTRAQILLTWTEPDNTDGSTIIDGHHYEIRYRPVFASAYPATWDEAANETWDGLLTWMQPLVPPFSLDEWQVVEAPFDVEQFMLNELFPSVTYEFQIRAVDSANPPNRSAWSASTVFIASRDTVPPSQPAAPVVAGSRLAIQVIHHLGTSAGGEFNLEQDTQYLEVHVSADPLHFPDETSLVGRLVVNAALHAGTPVVGSFPVDETTERQVRVVAVDRNGNRSNASNAAAVTIELIDDAHISDLTVSKLTSGTGTFNMLLAGSIKTAESGERIVLDQDGVALYDSGGTLKASMDPATGQIRCYSTGDVTHTSTAHGLQLGQSTGQNLVLDENEIMSRLTGSYGPLALNREGGLVFIGGKVGGFAEDDSDAGVIPDTEDHRIYLRGSVHAWNVRNSDYADERPPFLVGVRGGSHMWIDAGSIGCTGAGGDSPATLTIMPKLADGSSHNVSIAVASEELNIERLGTDNSGIRSQAGADCAIQWFNGAIRIRTNGYLAYQEIIAQAFTVSSSETVKKDIQDFDALDIIKAAPAKQYKYKPEVGGKDTWHFGPMAETLPDKLVHVTKDPTPIPEDQEPETQLTVDVGALTGVTWEAVRQLTERLETLEAELTELRK